MERPQSAPAWRSRSYADRRTRIHWETSSTRSQTPPPCWPSRQLSSTSSARSGRTSTASSSSWDAALHWQEPGQPQQSYAHRLAQAWRERRDAARVHTSRLLLQQKALRRAFVCWHVLALRGGRQALASAALHACRSSLERGWHVSPVLLSFLSGCRRCKFASGIPHGKCQIILTSVHAASLAPPTQSVQSRQRVLPLD